MHEPGATSRTGRNTGGHRLLARWGTQALVGLIRGYRVLVSPLLGPCCRFHPSCSCYAMEALQRHGIRRGLYLSAKRLLKCHPWHPGGPDPVPGPKAKALVSSWSIRG